MNDLITPQSFILFETMVLAEYTNLVCASRVALVMIANISEGKYLQNDIPEQYVCL